MENGAEVVAKGTIQGHEAGGEVVIERSPEGYVLHLKDYWIAQGAPDVHIYLSPDKGGDAEVEGAHDFGKTMQFSGELSYPIPKDYEVSQIRSVVVYCKVYSVTFGVAVLEHVQARNE